VPPEAPDGFNGEAGPAVGREHPVRLGLYQLDVRGLEQQIPDLLGQGFAASTMTRAHRSVIA
jgi:hypothetical protein